MTPQLSEKDLELIDLNRKWVDTCKRFAPDYFAREDSYPETKKVESFLDIISRLQSALEKCVEQRDGLLHNTTANIYQWNEAMKSDNQELEAILKGCGE